MCVLIYRFVYLAIYTHMMCKCLPVYVKDTTNKVGRPPTLETCLWNDVTFLYYLSNIWCNE